MSKKTIDTDFHFLIRKENNTYVVYIPELDLTTHGDSEQDAAKAAFQASKLFLEGLEKMGTTEQVLLELGWKKNLNAKQNEFPFYSPCWGTRKMNLRTVLEA